MKTGYKITHFLAMEHSRGIAWSGTIVYDGKPVGKCYNDGNGGCNDYCWNTEQEEEAFLEAAKKAFPHNKWAAPDSLVTALLMETTE